jgi:hypothetical protein
VDVAELAESAATARRQAEQVRRARSHCRFAPPLSHFIPYSLPYSVPLFLKRQCDRTRQARQQLEEAEEFYSREGSESSARAANVEQVRIQFILLRTKFFATFATLSRIRCHQYTFALHTCEF